MDSQRIVFELVVPGFDWMQVLSMVETGLAVSAVVMAGSVSSYLFVRKISDEVMKALGGFILLPFVWSLPYMILRYTINNFLDIEIVDSDRLAELESKASSLDDFFGVDENEE